MPDKKLTDNLANNSPILANELSDGEIKKALERLKNTKDYLKEQYQEQVKKCPYPELKPIAKQTYEDNKKAFDIAIKAIEEFNRLQAEIKKLTSGKCIYLSDDETTEYCVEGPCPNYKTVIQVKAEAYKEFAEKSVERVEKARKKYQKLCKEQGEEMEEHMNIHFNGITKIINNLLKEMEGDKQLHTDFYVILGGYYGKSKHCNSKMV